MDNSSSLDSILQEGYSALQSQNSTRALTIFSQGVSVHAGQPDLYLGKAIALKQLFRLEEAETAIHQLLEIFPAYEPGLNLLEKIKGEKSLSQLVHVNEYLKMFPDRGETLRMQSCATLEGRPVPEMYKVKDCLILGKNAVLIAESGQVFRESSFYELNSVLSSVDIELEKSKVKGQLQGEFLPLCALWNEGFWHWMMECLPKVVIAESCGYKGYYIVPPARKFIYESLAMLGVEPSRLLDYTGIPTNVETLVIPETFQGTSELYYYPGLMHEIRARVFSRIKNKPAQQARRLYISRKNTLRGGKVINEVELMKLLSQYGIEQVYMEDLTFEQQVELDSSAETLIAPHGAGMVHSLFIKEDSLVLELFSPNRVMPCMFPVLNCLKHDYHMVVSNNVQSGPYMHGEEIVANIGVLKLILDKKYC